MKKKPYHVFSVVLRSRLFQQISLLYGGFSKYARAEFRNKFYNPDKNEL